MERIQHYFPEQKDPRRGNEWIRNPFAPIVNVQQLNISVDLKDKLLELSADESLRNSFESNSLASFWVKIKAEYPRLSGMAINPFVPGVLYVERLLNLGLLFVYYIFEYS